MKTENSDSEADGAAGVDLFGAPLTQIRERWGRPSFAKNKENQELVALLGAAAWSQARIAAHLGCDEKTLRKHFSREIERGSDLIEGMALQVTLAKMRTGNSVAVTRILEIVDRGRALTGPRKPADEPKPEPLGKKAQRQLDAETAHRESSWAELLDESPPENGRPLS